MIKVGTEGIIELTDMDFETGEIISNLFDIMIKGDNIFDLSTSCDRKRVVQLAQKYDFTSELRTIKHHLQLALSEHDPKKRSPRAIFRIALMLDEHELCRRAIIKAGGANWKFTAGDETGKEEQFGDSVKDAGVFDMTGWSLDALETAPIEIVWALLRASHKAPDMSSGKLQAEYDVTAANYARLMALKGMSSLSKISRIANAPTGAPKFA